VIRVLIADDQAVVRSGFRSILEDEGDIVVVGDAADGDAAVRLAAALRPDVVLMDIRMPVLDGITATERLAGRGVDEPVDVLVVTTFDLDEYVFRALRAGARGFLLKDVDPEELVRAVRVVAAGDGLVAPAVTRRLIDEFTRHSIPALHPRETTMLTRREREVLLLVAEGLSNAEIAGRLWVEASTVKTHLGSVLLKLDLRDRVQAVVYAYEHGLVRPGGS
jgi:DNA-binding NarL/FixJ family response regulator